MYDSNTFVADFLMFDLLLDIFTALTKMDEKRTEFIWHWNKNTQINDGLQAVDNGKAQTIYMHIISESESHHNRSMCATEINGNNMFALHTLPPLVMEWTLFGLVRFALSIMAARQQNTHRRKRNEKPECNRIIDILQLKYETNAGCGFCVVFSFDYCSLVSDVRLWSILPIMICKKKKNWQMFIDRSIVAGCSLTICLHRCKRTEGMTLHSYFSARIGQCFTKYH